MNTNSIKKIKKISNRKLKKWKKDSTVNNENFHDKLFKYQ